MRHYDVQLIGGMVLDDGRIAEMQTGEGKTLVAVLPAIRHALRGGHTHVLTFNDYLARRDAAWMGPIYEALGVSVGHIQQAMSPSERRAAYAADVTYVTAREAGFDYLRDGLCYDPADRVHQPFSYGIVDEADSILIDEARIPLVIAGDRGHDEPHNASRLASLAGALRPGSTSPPIRSAATCSSPTLGSSTSSTRWAAATSNSPKTWSGSLGFAWRYTPGSYCIATSTT